VANSTTQLPPSSLGAGLYQRITVPVWRSRRERGILETEFGEGAEGKRRRKVGQVVGGEWVWSVSRSWLRLRLDHACGFVFCIIPLRATMDSTEFGHWRHSVCCSNYVVCALSPSVILLIFMMLRKTQHHLQLGFKLQLSSVFFAQEQGHCHCHCQTSNDRP